MQSGPVSITDPSVIIDNAKQYISNPDSLALIQKGIDFATKCHDGQFRKSGEPYVVHVYCVAYYLTNLKLSPQTIVAGLLHDVVEDCGITKEQLANEFGEQVADMVEAVDTYWTAQGDGEFELSWSEEKQGYICEYEDFYGIVKFKDGKICAFADYVSGKEKATETFIFYDFGEVEDFSLPPVG